MHGELGYTDRNLVEKLFQTYAMRIERFHGTWDGSQASAGLLPTPPNIITIAATKHSIINHQLKHSNREIYNNTAPKYIYLIVLTSRSGYPLLLSIINIEIEKFG